MDQSSEKQPTNYYEQVYKNSIKSDIQFILRDRDEDRAHDKVVKAHKQILGPLNPVLLDTFISQPEQTKIEIYDLDPEAFQNFIDFLYTGKISDEDITEELFMVAHKYVDPTLKKLCRQKLGQNLSIENAASRLLTFFNCKEKKLIKTTCIFLARNYIDVKHRANFKEIIERYEVIDTLFKTFDECDVTILTELTNPDQETIFDAAKSSDLTISVQTSLFLAHRDILSRRNAVLKTAIEALPSTSNSIEFYDVDSKTVKIFLKFIYTLDVNPGDISKKLMIMAHKYVDLALEKICENHLLSELCEANAVELLLLSIDVQNEKLKTEVSKFVADNYKVMKNRVDFQKVKENPVAVEAVFGQFAVKVDSLFKSLEKRESRDSYRNRFVLKIPSTFNEVRFYWNNIAWKMITKCIIEDKITWLGFYLYRENIPIIHQVVFSFKVISSIDESHNESSTDITHSFSPKNIVIGFPKFITLYKLSDGCRGLVTNGTVTVELNARFV